MGYVHHVYIDFSKMYPPILRKYIPQSIPSLSRRCTCFPGSCPKVNVPSHSSLRIWTGPSATNLRRVMHETTHLSTYETLKKCPGVHKVFLRYTVIIWPTYDVTATAADQIGAVYSNMEIMTLSSSWRRLWLGTPMFDMIFSRAFVTFPPFLLTDRTCSCSRCLVSIWIPNYRSNGSEEMSQPTIVKAIVYPIYLLVTRTALVL